MAEERFMKMSPEEKRIWFERQEQRKKQTGGIAPTNEQPTRVGPGRENEIFECAATRRAAGVYVQNY